MATKQQVLTLRAQSPDLTSVQIAEQLGCMPEYVRATISRERCAPFKVRKKAGTRSTWSGQEIIALLRMRDVEKKRWGAIAKELGRPLSTCSARYRVENLPLLGRRPNGVERVRNIPNDILLDARRRNMAERTITAMIFGDPAPGQSALDKRQGAPA